MKKELVSSYWLNLTILTLLIIFGISSPLYADTIIYDYDGLHRLIKTVYPGGDVENYTYDAVGNLLSTTITTCTLYTYYRDADGDTYGDTNITTAHCFAPTGYVADNTDCDDTIASINPGATEVCNGVDDDCDTEVDEGVTSTFYRDADGDTYGDSTITTQACSAPSGYVADSTDCDDSISSINPGATEVCNGVDDDCDTEVDEGVTSTFYRDADGDNYGDSSITTQACAAPSGYVADNTDCDDSISSINPGATEICDGLDNDCDAGTADGADEAWLGFACDGADSGICTEGSYICSGGIQVCNDYTGDDIEVCNGEDDDCDTEVDEGVTSTFYRDADVDTYGDSTITTQACSAPSGYVADNTDCNDSISSINPGATEICNDGLDNDCDGIVKLGIYDDFTSSNGNWSNVTGDNADWTWHSGSTPTPNTGPACDHTSCSGHYMYIEATGAGAEVARLESIEIDLNQTTTPLLEFWYHMHGAQMGSLYVDIYEDGSWDMGVWSKSGNQGTVWNKRIINLSDYIGSTIKIRFRGITSVFGTSDIAIDDVSITEQEVCEDGVDNDCDGQTDEGC